VIVGKRVDPCTSDLKGAKRRKQGLETTIEASEGRQLDE